jgi:ribulose-phosphate 3-epimerase
LSVVITLAPSILSADFAALGSEIEQVAEDADQLHVDVMDGHFVPNITIGPPVVKAIRRHTSMFLDCHLMISEPSRYLEAFRKAGADSCTVHVEVGDTAALIDQMRRLELGVGLALNPETPFESVEPWLDQIDMLLVMTVHPGFGGQSFMASEVPKIRRARDRAQAAGLSLRIEVDGGIDSGTAPIVAAAGASVLVAGNAIFGQQDRAAACQEIRRAADAAGIG